MLLPLKMIVTKCREINFVCYICTWLVLLQQF